MSGRSNDISNQYQYLYRLDMGELETLLKLHTGREPDGDDGFLACVLDAMEQREREHPSGRIAPVDQAWRDFTRFYEPDAEDPDCISYLTEGQDNGKKRPRPAARVKWSRVILAAAIVCVVVTLLLPPALGFQHVAQMIGSWTDGQFSFVRNFPLSGRMLQRIRCRWKPPCATRNSPIWNLQWSSAESTRIYCPP